MGERVVQNTPGEARNSPGYAVKGRARYNAFAAEPHVIRWLFPTLRPLRLSLSSAFKFPFGCGSAALGLCV